MLYFTFASGRTLGIFSGRFAFKLHKEDEGNPETLVRHIEDLAVQSLGDTIKHEKTHHTVAEHSTLSKGLVGSRFLARVNFARGQLGKVRSYYAQRTVYFALAYRLHEALVDRMIRQERSTLTSLENRALLCLDRHIRLVANVTGNDLHFPRLSLSSIFGTLATKEFGVVLAVQSPDGSTQLREAAGRTGFSSIFNAAFQPSKRDHSFVRAVKYLYRKLNIEAVASLFGRRLDEKTLLSWSHCKLIGEYGAISQLFDPGLKASLDTPTIRLLNHAIGKYERPDDYFIEYLQSMLPFALGFQGEDLRASFSDICDLIDEIVESIQKQNLDGLSNRSKELLSKAGGLFFYHGN